MTSKHTCFLDAVSGRFYRHFHGARAFIISMCICVVFANQGVYAQVDIRDVKVDVSAESGLKARDMGIVEARRKAFQTVLDSDPGFAARFGGKKFPSDQDLEYATETFEIQSEKISAKRYIGTLTITFSPEGLDRLLAGQFMDQTVLDADGHEGDDEKAQTLSKKPSVNESGVDHRDVVLVPLYVTPDESHLWAKNPWREFWQRVPNDDVLKTTIPLGDLRDILSVSIEDFMTNRSVSIEKLMTRYQKPTIVFLSLKRFSNVGSDWELVVKIFKQGQIPFSSQPIPLMLDNESGDTQMAIFDMARIEAIKTIQDYQASGSVPNTAIQTLVVEARFNSFMQWQAIRKGLNTPQIKSFSVSNLTRKSAQIIVKVVGSASAVSEALSASGLSLTEGMPGRYNLTVGR